VADTCDTEQADGELLDPVCGEPLTEGEVVASCDHEGRTYFFKHIKCKFQFERDPSAYLGRAASPRLDTAAAVAAPTSSRLPRLLVAGGLVVGCVAVVAFLAVRPHEEVEPARHTEVTEASAPAVAPPPPPADVNTLAAPSRSEETSAPANEAAPASEVKVTKPGAAERKTATRAADTPRRSPPGDPQPSGEAHPAQTQFEKGNHFLAENKLNEAVAAFEKCVQLEPEFAEAYVGLGIAYQRLDRHRQASKALVNYLQLAPSGKNAAQARKLIREYGNGE
jgi:YHS domain-containing protein